MTTVWHAGNAGGFFCPGSAPRIPVKLSIQLHRRHLIVAAVDESRGNEQLLSHHRGWQLVQTSASVSSDTGNRQSSDKGQGVAKPHASRGRKFGPQSPRHLSNRLQSLKRTLMAQTPERRRKRCSICGEIGHNKLSCPSALDVMPRKNTVTCSQCGQPGHNSRSCPVKPRSTTVTCSQCGRDGHNCRTCPMRTKIKKGGAKATTNSMNSISRVCPFSVLCCNYSARHIMHHQLGIVIQP
jgi:hypothetical protein